MIVLILILLSFGGIIAYKTFFTKLVEYEEYKADLELNVSGDLQFYPNMRYKDRDITYSFESICNLGKREEVSEAFDILSGRTILGFDEVEEEGEIQILCSSIAPEPEQKGHFVAGEGGPTEVIRAGRNNIILSGKISLFKNDKCKTSKIALHEILHALGFDHNKNESSIMYPVTECDQILDDYIIEKIDSIYQSDSLPDLIIDEYKISSVGRYLDFKVSVLNVGFKEAGNFSLIVFADDNELRKIPLEEVGVGVKRIVDVENLRLPLRSFDKISFVVEFPENELDKENNRVEILLNKV
tara:strand:- start:362 stop:1258 length:897 start_codon:yes stop_codon:yes gene_type:complete